MSSSDTSARRLDNIDAMRALAIVSVMLYHFTSRWPLALIEAQRLPFRVDYGWAGVDLFFMVSGYCMFMTLDRCRTLATFWARRIARLQPSYMVAVVLTFSVVSLAGLPGNEVSAKVALGNLVWLNILPSWGHVDGAYWSLVAEVEFYFWFGLIYFLMRGRHVSLAWAGFAALGSLLVRAGEWGWPAGQALTAAARSVLIGPYAAAFLVGVACYEFRGEAWRQAIVPALVAIGLLLGSPRYEGVAWLGPAVAVFAVAMFRWQTLRLPRAITFIGLISYSLYLVHQLIGLVIIRALAPAIPDLLPRIVIAMTAMIALATLMFRTVELRWQRPIANALGPLVAAATGWLPASWRRLRGRARGVAGNRADNLEAAARRW